MSSHQKTKSHSSELTKGSAESKLNLQEFLQIAQSSIANDHDESKDADEEQEEDHQETFSKKSQEKRQNGRDKFGMYKNHAKFLKIRNQINQQEIKHQSMFDTINAKLTDRAFIEQAVLMGEKPVKTDKKVQKIQVSQKSALFNYTLTDEDATCYDKRYSDVGGFKNSSIHYSLVGRFEGRNPKCANELTQIMGRRYAYRYPDIIKLADYQNYRKLAQYANDHWQTKGFKEGRDAGVTYEREKAEKCADQEGRCFCDGRVWYGLTKRIDSKKSIDSFESLLEFSVKSKWGGKSKTVNCNDAQFGISNNQSNLFPGLNKQCFCEPRLSVQAFHAAEEGQTITCPKDQFIFFGQKFDEQGKLSTPEAMLKNQFTVALAQAGNQMKCQAEYFDGVDPLPGAQKHCYCDWQPKKLISREGFSNIQNFWKAKKAETQAREAQKRQLVEIQTDSIKAEQELKTKRSQAIKLATSNEQIRQDAAQKAETERKVSDEKAAKEQASIESIKKTEQEKAQKQTDDASKLKFVAETKLKEAEEAIKQAEQQKDKSTQEDLLEKAKFEKQAARKLLVEANMMAQQAEHDKLMADLKAKEQINKVQRELAQFKLLAAQEAEKRAAEAAAEKSKLQAEEVKLIALQQKKVAESEIQKAEIQKKIVEAIAQQKDIFESRVQVEQKAEKKAIQELSQKQITSLAEKQRQEKEAANELKRAQEEAKRSKVTADAAVAALKAQQTALEEEKRRLEAQIYEKTKIEQDNKQNLIKAQQGEEKAKSPEEIQKSQEVASIAQHELEEASREKQRSVEAKMTLEDELSRQMQQAKEATTLADKLALQQKKAEEKADQWKKAHEDGKIKAAKELSDAESAQRSFQNYLQKERLARQETYQKAQRLSGTDLKQAEEQTKLAQTAGQLAINLRKEQQEQENKRLLTDRKSSFQKQYPHVFANGPTGVSQVQISLASEQLADKLQQRLLQLNLGADIQQESISIKGSYVANQKQTGPSKQYKLTVITSDKNVKQVISEANSANKAPPEIVVTSVATGNYQYVQWVKTQTDIDEKLFQEKQMAPVSAPAMKAISQAQVAQKVVVAEKEEANETENEDDEDSSDDK